MYTKPEFFEDAQIQIQAPKGTKIKVTATSKSQIRLVAFKPDEFPLREMTELLYDSDIQLQTCEVIIDSPNINGFVLFVASGGQSVDIEINGQGKPILSLTHVDPLP